MRLKAIHLGLFGSPWDSLSPDSRVSLGFFGLFGSLWDLWVSLGLFGSPLVSLDSLKTPYSILLCSPYRSLVTLLKIMKALLLFKSFSDLNFFLI